MRGEIADERVGQGADSSSSSPALAPLPLLRFPLLACFAVVGSVGTIRCCVSDLFTLCLGLFEMIEQVSARIEPLAKVTGRRAAFARRTSRSILALRVMRLI